MKKIKFEYKLGPEGLHNEETVEFEDDATEEEIIKEFEDWVWNEFGDFVWWKEVAE